MSFASFLHSPSSICAHSVCRDWWCRLWYRCSSRGAMLRYTQSLLRTWMSCEENVIIISHSNSNLHSETLSLSEITRSDVETSSGYLDDGPCYKRHCAKRFSITTSLLTKTILMWCHPSQELRARAEKEQRLGEDIAKLREELVSVYWIATFVQRTFVAVDRHCNKVRCRRVLRTWVTSFILKGLYARDPPV